MMQQRTSQNDNDSTSCPVCGGTLPEFDTPQVDLNSDIITFRGDFVQLAPKEAEFLFVLLRAYPRWVDRGYAKQAIYASAEPDSNTISQFAWTANRKMKRGGLGIRIAARRGQGYRIEWEKKEHDH